MTKGAALPTSSEVTMVANSSDRAMLTDPTVRYRPVQVKGTRYIIKTEPPEPRQSAAR
jgi:hypothetical protein